MLCSQVANAAVERCCLGWWRRGSGRKSHTRPARSALSGSSVIVPPNATNSIKTIYLYAMFGHRLITWIHVSYNDRNSSPSESRSYCCAVQLFSCPRPPNYVHPSFHMFDLRLPSSRLREFGRYSKVINWGGHCVGTSRSRCKPHSHRFDSDAKHRRGGNGSRILFARSMQSL